MRKFKSKWTSLLLAVSCIFACLGVAILVRSNDGIVASAKTTYEITCTLSAANGSSTTALNAYPTDLKQKPDFMDPDWAYNFTFVEGTGSGMTFNGVQFTADLKKPGQDFYIGLGGNSAVEGDVFTIDGEFYNATVDVSIIFHNSSIIYSQDGWLPNYHKFEVGKLAFEKGDSKGIYFKPVDDTKVLPINNWTAPFSYVSGTGITVNDEMISFENSVKSPEGSFYVDLGANAEVGAILKIGGTLRCEQFGTDYVIEESVFTWNGEAWTVDGEEPVPPVEKEYTIVNVGALGVSSGDASHVYVATVDKNVSLPVNDWTTAFAYDSGDYITLDGEAVNYNDVKSIGDNKMYIGGLANVQEGSVLKISGTIVYEPQLVKYVLADSEFVWTNGAWVNTAEIVEYELSGLYATDNSVANQLYLKMEGAELPIQSWAFLFNCSTGITVNGEPAVLHEMKSAPEGIFLLFDAVAEGAEVIVSGEFVAETISVKYIIEETKLVWNGSAWEGYVPPVVEPEYTVFNVGAVGVASGDASHVYVSPVGVGVTLPISDWNTAFAYVSGDYITLDGEAVNYNDVKSVGDNKMYIGSLANVQDGSVLKISGEIAYEPQLVKYVLADSEFVWTNGAWKNTAETAEYELSDLYATSDSKANQLYLKMEGADLPVQSWAFPFNCSTGITVNGEPAALHEMKSVPEGLWLLFDAVAEGAEVIVSGEFVSDAIAVKYVVEETKLVWDGSAWTVASDDPIPPVDKEYTVINVGSVVAGSESSNVGLFLVPTDTNVDLVVSSWEQRDQITYDSGYGITVDDEMISFDNAVKAVGGKIYIGISPVEEGAVLKVGGTFVCEYYAIKYVIEEAEFVWTGSAWKLVVEEKNYDISELAPVDPTNVPNQIYLKMENGDVLPVQSWDVVFVLESGVGLTVNGEPADILEMKSAPEGLFLLVSSLDEPAVLTLSGTFYCDALATRYVIEESKFEWTGAVWANYLPYESIDLGAVKVSSGDNSSIYFAPTDETLELPISSWDDAFSYSSGIGITLNGTMIDMLNTVKSVGNKFFVDIDEGLVEIGAVLEIGGTFRSSVELIQYVIEDCKFIFTENGWMTELDIHKNAKLATLDEAFAEYVEADYHPYGWKKMIEIVDTCKDAVALAADEASVDALVSEAILALADVPNKEQSDAMLDIVKEGAKTDVSEYKAEADYSAENWATIQAIVAKATTDIDACTEVTEVENLVAKAKADMDAVMTLAQYEEYLAKANAAKAELASYKAEADYKAEQWAEIQAIIAEAGAMIDGAFADDAKTAQVVAEAKVKMDAVLTAVEHDAAKAVVDAAKAELAGYKAEADYKAEQWAEIQAALTVAGAKLDAALGNDEEIAKIVADAKTALDAVKTAVVVDAENLANAKEQAANDVRAYYNSIDHSLYSVEAESEISAFVAAAITAIEEATTIAEAEGVVATFKANVDGVAKMSSSNSDKKSGGCGSSISNGLFAGVMPVLALAIVMIIRKRKEA